MATETMVREGESNSQQWGGTEGVIPSNSSSNTFFVVLKGFLYGYVDLDIACLGRIRQKPNI